MAAWDLSPVARLYSESLGAHGAAPQGVGWKDLASQRLRFAKLLEVARDFPQPFSINDLGCGYGALHGFLRELGFGISAYHGYDISEHMLAEARRQVSAADAEFHCGARLTTTANFSVASGIFNVRLAATIPEWEAYIEATLRDLAEHSDVGFAFNLLTTYADYYEEHLYYGDPRHYFDFCKRLLPRVMLLHDYPLYEWTIVARRA